MRPCKPRAPLPAPRLRPGWCGRRTASCAPWPADLRLPASQLDPVAAEVVHEQGTLRQLLWRKELERQTDTGLHHQIKAKVREARPCLPVAVVPAQEHRDIPVRVRAGVAAGAGAEQQDAFEPVAVEALQLALQAA